MSNRILKLKKIMDSIEQGPEKSSQATNGSANKKCNELKKVEKKCRHVIIDEEDNEMEQTNFAAGKTRKATGQNAKQSTSSTSSSAAYIGAEKFQILLKERADNDAKLLESINSINSDLVAFREANKNLQKNEKKTKAELATTKREGIEAKGKITTLNAENQHLKAVIEEQKKQITNFEDLADMLQNELKNEKNLHSNALDELLDCRLKCSQLEEKVTKNEKQIASLNANLKTKTTELASAREEAAENLEKFEQLKEIFVKYSTLMGSKYSAKKAARNEENKKNSAFAGETDSTKNISTSETLDASSLRQNTPIPESPLNCQRPRIEQFSPITFSASNHGKTRRISCQFVEEFLENFAKEGDKRPKEWPLLILDADGNVEHIEESDNSMDETAAMEKPFSRTNSKIVVDNDDESATPTPEICANETENAEIDSVVLDPRPSTSGTQSANNSASSYSLRHMIKSRDGLKRGRRDLNEQFGIFHQQAEQRENEMNAENKKKKIDGRKTQ